MGGKEGEEGARERGGRRGGKEGVERKRRGEEESGEEGDGCKYTRIIRGRKTGSQGSMTVLGRLGEGGQEGASG